MALGELMPINISEVKNRFKFHPATPETGPKHDLVREKCLELAEFLIKNTPESREQSLALTSLQETMMWANAAIAIHSGKSN